MNCNISKYIIITGVLTATCISIIGQDLKKDITVTKSYVPSIQEANKINQMPVFNDTGYVEPDYKYQVKPFAFHIPFKVKPVPSAKMAKETWDNVYSNYALLGFGNPFSPLAELSINSGRTKNYSYGLDLYHHSANGKVRLKKDPNYKVNAPFSYTSINGNGKYILDYASLQGSIGYNHHRLAYYGVDTAFLDSYKEDSNKQFYNNAYFDLLFKSTNLAYDQPDYVTKISYNFFSDKTGYSENNFSLSGTYMHPYKKLKLGGTLLYQVSMPSQPADSGSSSIFLFKPTVSKKIQNVNISAGLNIWVDNYQSLSTMYSQPFASIDVVVVPEVLQAQLSYESQLQLNNATYLTAVNPFLKSGITSPTTYSKNIFSANITADISNTSSMALAVSYSNNKDQVLWRNEATSTLKNKFVPVIDDVETIKVKSSFIFTPTKSFNATLEAGFNNYTTLREKKAWGLPSFEGNATIRYNIQDKIISTTQVYIVGPRYYETVANTSKSLPTFVDFSENVEYQYTKLFSIFVQIKNLTASQYEYWNNYSSYRFQFMAGVRYVF